MGTQASQILQGTLIRLLKPIVRMMIKHNVPLGSFVEILKHAYVTIAKEELEIPGKKLSDSRISVVTGIPRKDIKNHFEPPCIFDQDIVKEHNRAARVLTGWVQDSSFHTSDAKPMDLELEGLKKGDPSFETLVLKYSGGVPPRAVLDELLRVGAVRKLEDDKIRLVSFGYIPEKDDLQQAEIVSKEMSDFLNTIDHNLTHDMEDSYVQLSVRCDNLPEEIMQKLRGMSKEKAYALLQDLATFMSHYDRDQNDNVFGTGRKRAVLGVYYYEDDVEEGEDKNEESK